MSVIPEPPPKVVPGDLISISDFAQQYRVDASVVRSWIKMGYIGYMLDGPRKMRKISKAEVLVPIEPATTPPTPSMGTSIPLMTFVTPTPESAKFPSPQGSVNHGKQQPPHSGGSHHRGSGRR